MELSILWVVLGFIVGLIIQYFVLSLCVFKRHYKKKSDKLFNDTVKLVLCNRDDGEQKIVNDEQSMKIQFDEYIKHFNYLKKGETIRYDETNK